VVKKIVHQSSSFTVLQLSLPKGSRPSVLTLCASNGCLGSVHIGMQLSVVGMMQKHPDYGKQLAVHTVETSTPAKESIGGPRAVLTSGAIKGLGPVKAAAMLHKFGDEALTMLLEKDERLLSLPGMGAKTLKRFHEAAVAHSGKAGEHQAVAFALNLGLSPSEAQTLLAKLGPGLEDKVRRDPYCLCLHLPELGFSRVDHLARSRLDASADNAGRAAGAVLARLRLVARDGHCFDDRVLLLGAVQRAISCAELPAAKALKLARGALDRLRKDGLVHSDFPPPSRPGAGGAPLALLGWNTEGGRLATSSLTLGVVVVGAAAAAAATVMRRLPGPYDIEGGPRDPQLAPYVYLQAAVREEEAVATAVRRRLPARGASSGDDAWGGESATAGTDSPGSRLSPTLSGLQRLAVLRCASMGADATTHGKGGKLGRLLVLTGGPGTGKTFTVRQIVHSWRQQGKRVMLACPTARAASVLSESVGLPAKTIHRLLEYNPQKRAFLRDARAPLECDAVVIDEASMLDINLAASFLEALREECVVLLVGDANQLPSVRNCP
jgi:exodeoxyribonuclease V alpha subunit